MKRIIEIPDEVLESKHYCQYFSAWSTKLTELIEQSTPYDDSGDLISRSALKTELEVYRHTRNYKSDEDEAQNALLDNVLEDIDNAQTVEAFTKEDMAGAYNEGYACGGRESKRPNEQIAWEQGYEAGLAQGKQDRPKGDILQKIPKYFVYDTETSEFYCYRNKYTGKEIHIVKNPPTYVLDKRPQGDLISREALKDITYINKGNFNTVEGIREWIDNAPPVPQITVFAENADEKAVADLKAELENVIKSRPKGEWTVTKLQHGEDVTCPFCNARPTKIEYGYYLRDNFCHECGADMRKGGAE